ncbi:MAG TPA: hypothetical protein VIV12_16840 [Streptosporangiaceae bacterium]
MRRISRAFPALFAASLALPFGRRVGDRRHLSAALLALVWAGLVRIFLLQHRCPECEFPLPPAGKPTVHHPSARPWPPTNLWPLAVLSLGESWHNMHQLGSGPRPARRRPRPGRSVRRADPRVRRLRGAGGVQWPSPAWLEQHRHRADDAAGLALAPEGRASAPAQEQEQEQTASLLAR